jgi:hypothetical protein
MEAISSCLMPFTDKPKTLASAPDWCYRWPNGVKGCTRKVSLPTIGSQLEASAPRLEIKSADLIAQLNGLVTSEGKYPNHQKGTQWSHQQ